MRIPLLGAGVEDWEEYTQDFKIAETINMYYEPGEREDQGLWLPTPGVELGVASPAIGAATVRGMFFESVRDRLYVVSGNDLSYFNGSLSTETDVGDLTTSTGRVQFAVNMQSDEMLIVDGTNGYIVDMGANTITTITDADYPDTADVCAFIDGYFLVAVSRETTNPGRFYWSDLNAGLNWTSTNFATKEGGGDVLVDIFVDRREIFLFGELTTEVWYDSGDLDQIFERYQGGYIEVGVVDPGLVAKVDNSLMFPSVTSGGAGQVVRLGDGWAPQIVSNRQIESRLSNVNWNATGFGYRWIWRGHEWYCINTDSSHGTYVYDATTQLWHRHAHYSSASWPNKERITAFATGGRSSAEQKASTAYFGFITDGAVGKCNLESDGSFPHTIHNAGSLNDSDEIRRRITSPILRSLDGERIRFSHLEVDQPPANETLETDWELTWSRDGGATFNTARTFVDGDRWIVRKPGSARQWVFRLEKDSTTDTAPIAGIWGKIYGKRYSADEGGYK